MTSPVDPRPSWIRRRTRELHKSGLSWPAARAQAETEADDKFGEENGDNGNGATG